MITIPNTDYKINISNKQIFHNNNKVLPIDNKITVEILDGTKISKSIDW